MTAPRHVDVGAYVLGILDEPDEAAYEEHFAQCEQCRREFIELADLPAILDTMKPAKRESEPARGSQPTLPPLDALIDFRQIAPPGQPPPGPSVPPQLRPTGATRPHKIPTPEPTNGTRTNGNARRMGHPIPAPKPAERPGAEGTGRQNPVNRPNVDPSCANGTGTHTPVNPSRANGTGRHAPVTPDPGARPAPTGHPQQVAGRPRSAPRTDSTGRAPVPRAEGTGRSLPATRPPGTRPPSKPPANRRGSRKPAWLAAAAVLAVALSVGMVIGLTSGDSGGNQVADPATSAPPTTPSGAVAGAHVVSGTDPTTGITAIITVEPVTGGTGIAAALYEVDGPREGELLVVSRFGDRERIATWKAGEGDGEAVRTTGVSALPQHDISRFEIHGPAGEPLVVVPI